MQAYIVDSDLLFLFASLAPERSPVKDMQREWNKLSREFKACNVVLAKMYRKLGETPPKRIKFPQSRTIFSVPDFSVVSRNVPRLLWKTYTPKKGKVTYLLQIAWLCVCVTADRRISEWIHRTAGSWARVSSVSWGALSSVWRNRGE